MGAVLPEQHSREPPRQERVMNGTPSNRIYKGREVGALREELDSHLSQGYPRHSLHSAKELFIQGKRTEDRVHTTHVISASSLLTKTGFWPEPSHGLGLVAYYTQGAPRVHTRVS